MKIIIFLLIFLYSVPSFSIDYNHVLNNFSSHFNEQGFSHKTIVTNIRKNGRSGAQFGQDQDYFYITIFDGMLKNNWVSKEVLELLLCHELGHGLGENLTNKDHAPEGEADFYVSKCLYSLWEERDPLSFSRSVFHDEINNYLSKECVNTRNPEICFHILKNALIIINERRTIDDKYGAHPIRNYKYFTPTLYGTRQKHSSHMCRYSSIRNSALNIKRPRCWFVPESRKGMNGYYGKITKNVGKYYVESTLSGQRHMIIFNNIHVENFLGKDCLVEGYRKQTFFGKEYIDSRYTTCGTNINH